MRVFFTKRKEWLLVILSVLFFGSINAQFSPEESRQIDSLLLVIHNNKSHDTSKVASYIWLGEILYTAHNDTLLSLCNKAREIAEKALSKKPSEKVSKTLKTSLGWAYNNIGGALFSQGNLSEAQIYYEKSLKIWEELQDKEGIAYSLNNIGGIYDNQGDVPKAMEYFHQSLKLREEIGDKDEIAGSLSNIGMIYLYHGDYTLAFEYLSKTLQIRLELGRKVDIADIYNNIGLLYKKQGDPNVISSKEESIKAGADLALEYYLKSLKIREEIADKRGIAESYNNIGTNYRDIGEFDKAREYYEKSLVLNEENKDQDGITLSCHNIGLMLFKSGKYKEAHEVVERGLGVAKELGFPTPIQHNAALLSKIALKEGNCDLALEMRNLEIQMIDSAKSERNIKALVEQQAKYEFEKIQAIQEKEHEKEIALAQEREEKQKIVSYSAAGASILLIAFLVFVFNRLKISRRQKSQIEGQKQDLEKAHHQLTEHHMEIQDSIKYAKRIQEAILPSMAAMQSDLKNGFVLYKPKDVVAGDFFWMELAPPDLPRGEVNYSPPLGELEGAIFFAAADCTGHGVPGAMMSVVCSNALSKALLEEKAQSTGELLDKTREIVVSRMAKSGEDVKDGMDVSVCALNFKTMKLQWSGANNPLWVVRPNRTPSLPGWQTGGTEVTGTGNVPSSSDFSTPPALPSVSLEITNQSGASSPSATDSSYISHLNTQFSLQEIKADKQPIGKYADNSPFTTHEIELEKGDTLYIFTDGYQDQFGGEKGKKFKASQLKEKLLSIQHLGMNEQKEFLNTTFENWKGQIEQVDDVCVIGVRI